MLFLHCKNIKNSLLSFLVPVFGLVGIMLMQAILSDEFSEGIVLYLARNSSISSDANIVDLFFPYVDQLIPS